MWYAEQCSQRKKWVETSVGNTDKIKTNILAFKNKLVVKVLIMKSFLWEVPLLTIKQWH